MDSEKSICNENQVVKIMRLGLHGTAHVTMNYCSVTLKFQNVLSMFQYDLCSFFIVIAIAIAICATFHRDYLN